MSQSGVVLFLAKNILPHLIIKLPGVSGIFGVILGIKPLRGVFFSIAVVSTCVWWLAHSKDLTSLEIAFIYPCCVLFSSVSVIC